MKSSNSESRRRLRVLAVGQDEDVHWLFDREISRLGHLLVRARDANKARTILLEGQVAMVIIEDRPGDEDQLILVRYIRQTFPNTEVLLYTSTPSHQRAFTFGNLNVAAYLVKPFTDGPSLDEVCEETLARYAKNTSEEQTSEKQDLRMNALARLVDRMPMGIVLVTARRRVLLANQTAKEILSEQNGLRTNAEGILEAGRPQDTATMQRLIDAALPGQELGIFPTGGATTIQRRGDRPPLCLMVGPLEMALNNVRAPDSVVAVVITDPEQELAPREKILCRLWGLSPKQAQFGAKLMKGRSIAAASQEMNIEVSTGRSHLKALYRRTETSHMSELVARLWSSPATIRLGKGMIGAEDPDAGQQGGK